MTETGGTVCAILLRFLCRRTNLKEQAIMSLAKRLRALQQLPVRMRDGRLMYLDLRNNTSMPYLLERELSWEYYETEFVRSVVRPDDIALDIGANVGWYSSLMSDLVGPSGRVYAFEPNPNLLPVLNRLASDSVQLSIHGIGISDCEKEEYLHISEDWISCSYGEVEKSVEDQNTHLTSLDIFLERENISRVEFVKCDAEGAELDILKGAQRTLNGDRPPMWLMEMSSVETAKFGYHPERLVETFTQVPDVPYRVLMINQEDGRLEPLVMPTSEPFWFNAVFVPPWLEERLAEHHAQVN